MEAVHYFQPGTWWLHDPFAHGKSALWAEAVGRIGSAAEALGQIEVEEAPLEAWFHASLWGNRADLSNLILTAEVRGRQSLVERDNLLIDDMLRIGEPIREGNFPHIAFINDNVGVELGSDLCLADLLLSLGRAQKITFHLKADPCFVSDAMVKDVRGTVATFASERSTELPWWSLQELGGRLRTAMAQGRLVLVDDGSCTTALHSPQIPCRLHEALSGTDLVISKGDVNYRRLLSDRHWPFTPSTERIVDYFPTSLLILRTLKGEILTWLEGSVAERLSVEDPDWLLNGWRGLIEFIEGGKAQE